MHSPTPEPESDLDRLLEQLVASRLPEVLPVDALAAVHHPLSEKYGAKLVRSSQTPGEEYRTAELLSGFRELVCKRYRDDVARLGVATISRGAAIEILADGSIVPSVVVELRSSNGRSVLGNSEKLYETVGGPALVWIRENPTRDNLEIRAIYSREAFENELSTLRDRARELFSRPNERPLLLDYVIQTMEHSVIPLSGNSFSLTGARMKPRDLGDIVELATSRSSFIDCHIERDPLTFDLTFRFVFR